MTTTPREPRSLLPKILIVLGAFLFSLVGHRAGGFAGASVTLLLYLVCVWAVRSVSLQGGMR